MKIDLKKLNINLFKLVIFSIFSIITVIIVFVMFDGKSNITKWANFGDYFAGILNPILAFLAFLALVSTIILQSKSLKYSQKELKATRKELKKSAQAQKKQSKSLELQNKATNQQVFENTFFILLKELNIVIVNLLEDSKLKDEITKFSGHTSNIESLKMQFEIKNIGAIKVFLTLLYQLLKFVDKSSIEEKKMYTNIIRVYMTDDILSLLVINCKIFDYTSYKKFLEKYEFFEHLDYKNDNNIYFLDMFKEYDLKVFGNNSEIIDLINDKNNCYTNRVDNLEMRILDEI